MNVLLLNVSTELSFFLEDRLPSDFRLYPAQNGWEMRPILEKIAADCMVIDLTSRPESATCATQARKSVSCIIGICTKSQKRAVDSGVFDTLIIDPTPGDIAQMIADAGKKKW